MNFKELPEPEPFEYKLQIIESYLDTFGHVNNATYLELYEMARWDFIEKNNFGLKHIQEIKKGPVILEVNITYKKELKNREWITIRSLSQGFLNSLVMGLKQEMVNEKGDVCSVANFKVAYFDMQERKLLKPTAHWLKAIGYNV